MFKLVIPGDEVYNEATCEFSTVNDTVLRLEHSLVSLSKWESIWLKPFLSKDKKTVEETISYIKCMVLDEDVNDEVFSRLTPELVDSIIKYMESPMTATTIKSDKKNTSREIITSELIYYWMIALQIPIEFEKWHINRLFMIINVTNAKNNPGKKMSKNEILSRNRALNESRKKSINTSG